VTSHQSCTKENYMIYAVATSVHVCLGINLHSVSCEHSNKLEGSINSREFLDELSVSVANRNLFHGMNSHNNLYLVLYSYTQTHFGQINVACTCTLNK
jgi:hypothetical protein